MGVLGEDCCSIFRTMAESYLPLADESSRRRAGIVQHLVTMFAGFGMGCAMIYIAGVQPLAVILPADNMAAQLTQPAQRQFLQPLAAHPHAATPAQIQSLAHLESLAQIQAYSPFNNKKYETLSYLPQLSNDAIKKQIDFIIKNHWTPAWKCPMMAISTKTQRWGRTITIIGIGRCTSCQCSDAPIRTMLFAKSKLVRENIQTQR